MNRDQYRLVTHTYLPDGTSATFAAPWPDSRPLPCAGDEIVLATSPDGSHLSRCKVLSVEKLMIPPEPFQPSGDDFLDIAIGESAWDYQVFIYLQPIERISPKHLSGNVVPFPSPVK